MVTMERKNMNTNKEWTPQELRILLVSCRYPANLLQQKFFKYRSVNSVNYKLNEVRNYLNTRACYFNPVIDDELCWASNNRQLDYFSKKYRIPKKYIILRLVELGIAR